MTAFQLCELSHNVSVIAMSSYSCNCTQIQFLLFISYATCIAIQAFQGGDSLQVSQEGCKRILHRRIISSHQFLVFKQGSVVIETKTLSPTTAA